MILEQENLDKFALFRPFFKFKIWTYLTYSLIVNEYKRTY